LVPSIDQLYGGIPLSIENVTEADILSGFKKQDLVIELTSKFKGSAVRFNIIEPVLLIKPKVFSTV
jgi:hypothetical protein